MSKIGRNDPCPCGENGKKYKNCCLKKEQEKIEAEVAATREASTFEDGFAEEMGSNAFDMYAETHESGHILNLLTNLQLAEQNHGKNIRIELMADSVIKRLNTGSAGSYRQLRDAINTSHASNPMEDPPEELFTENVLFHGGNYTVMPGIVTKSGDIFRTMSEAIFMLKREFPKGFEERVRQGITFLLELGQLIFEDAGLRPNLYSEQEADEFNFPTRVKDYSISGEMMTNICTANGIDRSIVEYFIVDPSEVANYDRSYEETPLLRKPLVRFNDSYYFVTISAQLHAIKEFIIDTAKNYKCISLLSESYHDILFNEVMQSCMKMGWGATDITLPLDKTGLGVKDEVLQFDDRYLCYLVYEYQKDFNEHGYTAFENKPVEQYVDRTIDHLHNDPRFKDHKFLVFYVLGECGTNAYYAVPKPRYSEKVIWFSAFETIHLANTGEWRALSLLNYAKAFNKVARRMMGVQPIDAYSLYKSKNESFYLDDRVLPDMLTLMPGMGADIYLKAKQKRNLHGALTLYGSKMGYELVERFREYENIYASVYFKKKGALLVEGYSVPIWLKPEKNGDEAARFNLTTVEAIAVWLQKMQADLDPLLAPVQMPAITVELEIDPFFFEAHTEDDLKTSQLDSTFISTFSEGKLKFRVPPQLLIELQGGDNKGERLIMSEILKGFNQLPGISLTNKQIADIIDNNVPLGPGKMILLLNSQKDMRLDSRWLGRRHYLTDAAINRVLDDLVDIIKYPTKIPDAFKTTEEKVAFCNYTVKALLKHLSVMLEPYDNAALLEQLFELNEKLTHTREMNRYKIPAEIFCLGDKDGHVQKLIKDEHSLVHTSLSCRCLIEYLVVHPSSGDKFPGFAEIDEMLAVMNEIINYGMLSDGIHFQLDDPAIGLLPSGRIGISKSFFDDKLKPFSTATTVADVEYYMENFVDMMTTEEAALEDINQFWEPIDLAFKNDLGFELTTLVGISKVLISYAVQKETSVLLIKKAELLDRLSKTGVPGDEIERILEWLTLKPRVDYLTAPDGYRNEDVFPWKYNREFSLIKRPIIEILKNEETFVMYGIRNIEVAAMHIHNVFMAGRLKYGGAHIDAQLGIRREMNGKGFRQKVLEWFKSNGQFKVWDYEVTMKPNGHLKSSTNLGDIDTLVYDERRKTFYDIECKRTNQAKNIHEMKSEMDSYLGREGQNKKIQKHVDRHNWLLQHKEELKKFAGIGDGDVRVVSLLLTSEVLPLRYLAGDKLQLPIVFFPELKSQGTSLLNSLNNIQGN